LTAAEGPKGEEVLKEAERALRAVFE